jgi:hypothetical protein
LYSVHSSTREGRFHSKAIDGALSFTIPVSLKQSIASRA